MNCDISVSTNPSGMHTWPLWRIAIVFLHNCISLWPLRIYHLVNRICHNPTPSFSAISILLLSINFHKSILMGTFMEKATVYEIKLITNLLKVSELLNKLFVLIERYYLDIVVFKFDNSWIFLFYYASIWYINKDVSVK